MIKGRGVTVQFTRGKRVAPDTAFVSGNYASKAGDERRQGRVDRGGQGVVSVEFIDRGSQIEARLGVVVVGSVTHDPSAGGYFWAVFLPGLPRVPRPAGDADKGKRAIEHKVREWCEAAKLITARRSRS